MRSKTLLNRLPLLIPVVALRKRLKYRHLGAQSIDAVFGDIYRTGFWGSAESVSGTGSELEGTRRLREGLPLALRAVGARSLLDVPCGDCNWMAHTGFLGVESYLGCDIVPELIEANRQRHGSERVRFQVLDITRDPLPRADLVLCRDLFIHFSNAAVWQAFANLRRSGSQYLLATTDRTLRRNYDIVTGAAHELNLERAPFALPAPALFLDDPHPAGFMRGLGLWRIADLPTGPTASGGA